MLLSVVTKSMDKLPGVREMGEHIRTSLADVLGMAILIGSAMASEQIAPGIGFFWVLGFYLLNRIARKPLVELAVPTSGRHYVRYFSQYSLFIRFMVIK